MRALTFKPDFTTCSPDVSASLVGEALVQLLSWLCYVSGEKENGKNPQKQKQLVKEANSAIRSSLKQPIDLTLKEYSTISVPDSQQPLCAAEYREVLERRQLQESS